MNLDDMIREMRDALTVNSAQNLRHETWLKDHQEWLPGHDQAMIAHEKWLREHEAAVIAHEQWLREHEREMAEMARTHEQWLKEHQRDMAAIVKAEAERGRALDERIDKLVSAIGKFISERNGKS